MARFKTADVDKDENSITDITMLVYYNNFLVHTLSSNILILIMEMI